MPQEKTLKASLQNRLHLSSNSVASLPAALIFFRQSFYSLEPPQFNPVPPDLPTKEWIEAGAKGRCWRLQLLPITRPRRPFCKIYPNSPPCPRARLFHGARAFMHRSWGLGGYYALEQPQFNPSAQSHPVDIPTITA